MSCSVCLFVCNKEGNLKGESVVGAIFAILYGGELLYLRIFL